MGTYKRTHFKIFNGEILDEYNREPRIVQNQFFISTGGKEERSTKNNSTIKNNKAEITKIILLEMFTHTLLLTSKFSLKVLPKYLKFLKQLLSIF